ncbi:MAG: GTP 3',8-cyclase MoaA [Eggerthellaceae bacterium]|nr:GTP 3',8-cyclase MoaA [Eggerthellaceae bacterium]
MKDAHGRTIDYMRISLTDRCNLRCIYCMPAEGVCQVPHDQIMRFDEICRLVRIAADMGVRRFRLTGGEPLVRKGVIDLVREIAHTPGVEDVSMTTNGILLARYANDLREAGLRRVNISLDTLDSDQYRMITRGGDITSVLAGIDAALDAGFNPVKINAVAVRSLHQDFYAFAKLSLDRPLHMRFIEYMPVGDSSGVEGCGWGPQDVISCEEIMEQINQRAERDGVKALVPAGQKPDGGGPARYYQFPGAQGTVGFISPLSRHFCSECNRLRLTSEGMIRPCLFSDEQFSVREALREGTDDDVRALLTRALRLKPDEHTQGDHANATSTNMNRIGG